MIIEGNGNWIVDFYSMTCWNSKNKILISFEKKGDTLTGNIRKIPVELQEKWAFDPQSKNFIRNLVKEAKEAYLQAYNKYGFEYACNYGI